MSFVRLSGLFYMIWDMSHHYLFRWFHHRMTHHPTWDWKGEWISKVRKRPWFQKLSNTELAAYITKFGDRNWPRLKIPWAPSFLLKDLSTFHFPFLFTEVSLPFSSQRGTLSAGGAQGRRRGAGYLGRRSIDLSGALRLFKTKLGENISKK